MCEGTSTTVAESVELLQIRTPRPAVPPATPTPPGPYKAVLVVPVELAKTLAATSRTCDHCLALRSDVEVLGIVSNALGPA